MTTKKVKKVAKAKFPSEVYVIYERDTRGVDAHGFLIVSDTPNDAEDGQDVGVYMLSEVLKKRVYHELGD